MGTIPLFIPMMGRKAKPWSLKYTPYTAVAVSEKTTKIWLSPKISKEETVCRRIDGIPTP